MWVTYTAIAFTFVSLSAAQTEPTCSENCFVTFVGSSGCNSDLGCLCQNKSFVNSATCCIYDVCDGSDASTALNLLYKDCQGVGVDVANTCSGNAFAPSSSSADTAAATSTPSTSTSRNRGTSTTTGPTITTSEGGEKASSSPTTEPTGLGVSSTAPSTASTASVGGAASTAGSGSSLSSGAIAGIAVGAVVIGALIAAITIWIILKNRKAKKSNDGDEATERPDTSILPGKSELQGKASAVVLEQKRSEGAIIHGGSQGRNSDRAEKHSTVGDVPVATSMPELDTAPQTPYPSELSSTPYPSELSSQAHPSELSPQHLAYEAHADGLPVPELAAYPYAHSTADAPGAQYGPSQNTFSSSVTAVPTLGSSDPMQPSRYSDQALYDQEPSPGVTHLPRQSQESQGQSQPVAWPSKSSVDEVSQLMHEQTELEARRQTLLQLQQIQEQQAALRDRIAAAQQQARQDSHPS